MTREYKDIERIDGASIESNLIERQLGFESYNHDELGEQYKLKYKTKSNQVISFTPDESEATFDSVKLNKVVDPKDATTKEYVDGKVTESDITTVRPHLTGFVEPDDVAVNFDVTTRVVTIGLKSGVTKADYYVDGEMFSLATTISAIMDDSYVGLIFVFMDRNGIVRFTQEWQQNQLPILTLYRVSNNLSGVNPPKENEYLSIIRDYHGTTMDLSTREYLRSNVGTWLESGCYARREESKIAIERTEGIVVNGDIATPVEAVARTAPAIGYMTNTTTNAMTVEAPNVSWVPSVSSAEHGTFYQGPTGRVRSANTEGVWHLYYVRPDVRGGDWSDIVVPLEHHSTFLDRYKGIDDVVRRSAVHYLDFISDWKVLGFAFVEKGEITDYIDIASFQIKDLLYCGRLEKFLSTNERKNITFVSTVDELKNALSDISIQDIQITVDRLDIYGTNTPELNPTFEVNGIKRLLGNLRFCRDTESERDIIFIGTKDLNSTLYHYGNFETVVNTYKNACVIMAFPVGGEYVGVPKLKLDALNVVQGTLSIDDIATIEFNSATFVKETGYDHEDYITGWKDGTLRNNSMYILTSGVLPSTIQRAIDQGKHIFKIDNSVVLKDTTFYFGSHQYEFIGVGNHEQLLLENITLDSKRAYGFLSGTIIFKTSVTLKGLLTEPEDSGQWHGQPISFHKTLKCDNAILRKPASGSMSEIHIRHLTGNKLTIDNIHVVYETKSSNIEIELVNGATFSQGKWESHEIVSHSGNYLEEYNNTTCGSYIVNKEILENKIANITETQGLSDVLSKGNDAGGQDIVGVGKLGIGTDSPSSSLEIKVNDLGTNWISDYSKMSITSHDSHFDIVSTDHGKWGSAINFKQVANSSKNLDDSWSIIRQTSHNGDGDGSISITNGVKTNGWENRQIAKFNTDGTMELPESTTTEIEEAGAKAVITKEYVDSKIADSADHSKAIPRTALSANQEYFIAYARGGALQAGEAYDTRSGEIDLSFSIEANSHHNEVRLEVTKVLDQFIAKISNQFWHGGYQCLKSIKIYKSTQWHDGYVISVTPAVDCQFEGAYVTTKPDLWHGITPTTTRPSQAATATVLAMDLPSKSGYTVFNSIGAKLSGDTTNVGQYIDEFGNIRRSRVNWHSGKRVVEVSDKTSLFDSSDGILWHSANAYIDSTNSWRAYEAGYCSLICQNPADGAMKIFSTKATVAKDDIPGWSENFRVDKEGIAYLPESSTSEIDAAGGDAVTTKEYVDSKIANITETQGLSDVLSKGNDADGQTIENVGYLNVGDIDTGLHKHVWSGTAVLGKNDSPKVVVGHLNQPDPYVNGAVVGAHVSNLSDWDQLTFGATNYRFFNGQNSQIMTLNSNGTMTLPNATPPEIDAAGDQAVVTKEYTDSNYIRAAVSQTLYGLVNPNGDDTNWTRTTKSGLIPYTNGGASSLGTSSWPFSTVYGKKLIEDGLELAHKYVNMNSHSSVVENFTTVQQWHGPIHASHFIARNPVGGGAPTVGLPSDSGAYYYHWFVFAKRDMSGGTSGILTEMDTGKTWIGHKNVNTSALDWKRLVTSADLSLSNVLSKGNDAGGQDISNLQNITINKGQINFYDAFDDYRGCLKATPLWHGFAAYDSTGKLRFPVMDSVPGNPLWARNHSFNIKGFVDSISGNAHLKVGFDSVNGKACTVKGMYVAHIDEVNQPLVSNVYVNTSNYFQIAMEHGGVVDLTFRIYEDANGYPKCRMSGTISTINESTGTCKTINVSLFYKGFSEEDAIGDFLYSLTGDTTESSCMRLG